VETRAGDQGRPARSAVVELSPGIKLCVLIPPRPSDQDLRFAGELGVTHVYTWVPEELSGAAELTALRRRVEGAGLTLFNVGHGSLAKCDRIHLALPGRDEAISRFATFLRNLSCAGIHTTTFTFEPDGVWSTTAATARGGAAARAVDSAKLAEQPLSRGRRYDEETIWHNFAYFMERIIPVAEEAGVRLALHPNDPPLPEIAGIPCIIRSYESYRRAFAIADSDCLGMEFCTGCWLEGGAAFGDVEVAIGDFLARDKIFIVHFRNVSAPLPRFHETFVDEGYQDMNVLMRLFHAGGYRGTMVLDHTPPMAHDERAVHSGPANRPVATAYAIGYMKALLAAAGG
jgi:mannonate dehydratase